MNDFLTFLLCFGETPIWYHNVNLVKNLSILLLFFFLKNVSIFKNVVEKKKTSLIVFGQRSFLIEKVTRKPIVSCIFLYSLDSVIWFLRS